MTGFLVLAIWVSVGLLVLVGGAFLYVTDADADQGPPPTLRPVRDAASLPFGLDDGLDEYRAAWQRAADDWNRHCAEAMDVARDDFSLWSAELNDDRRRA